MIPSGLESFSLIEWLIFGFIGANLTIVSVCLLHSGVRRLGHNPAEDQQFK